MKRKNAITIGLMASSIILLLLLQFFWLRNSYHDAARGFRQETNLLFRNTIFAMHDSLIERSIQLVGTGDTLSDIQFPKRMMRFRTQRRQPFPPDSIIDYMNVTESSARIEIITSQGKTDTLTRMLRPLVSKLKYDAEPKTFIFKMIADSLESDSIRYYFSKALSHAGIPAEYKVVTFKRPTPKMKARVMDVPSDQFMSEFVPFTPVIHYAAIFENVPSLLLKEIAPQIMFSIFLTVLTLVSFYVMYRNLRAQQRLMQIKDDFISNVTHELKTPVATVSVALEALKNFKALNDPQRANEYLDIAQSELNRLTLMTDKILKTSVFEDQGIEVKREEINLDRIIEQVLSSMKLVFEKKKTELSYEKSGTDFALKGSQTDITHVLYNLVDNAIKYGGEKPTLKIKLEDRGEEFVLRVADSGIGIAPEYQKKIFEKFFRVPSGDIHDIKGYGLGLSYVAGVVKGHSGTIDVESAPGVGSTFTIRIPKRQDS